MELRGSPPRCHAQLMHTLGSPTVDVAAARNLAVELLDGVGTRLAHSLGVGRQADLLTAGYPPNQRGRIVAAAYLHDVGYSPRCRRTGWHPYDGARWLANQGHEPEICRLVMWHTAAWHEGRLRGLYADAVAEFGPPDQNSLDTAVLAASDMLTGPAGQTLTVDERLADIAHRYQPTSVVARAMTAAGAELRALVDRASDAAAQPR